MEIITMAKIKFKALNQRFGSEIEMTGISRITAAHQLNKQTKGSVYSFPLLSNPIHNEYIVTDQKSRQWKICPDGSIFTDDPNDINSVELVTPVLQRRDISLLKSSIRSVKAAGAFVNNSCGLHIHNDASKLSTFEICGLAKAFFKNQFLLYNAFNVIPYRESHSFPLKLHLYYDLVKYDPRNKRDLKKIIYNPKNFTCDVKKQGLNLANLWNDKKTIEFRLFNSTLNTKEIEAYIDFCLAFTSKARDFAILFREKELQEQHDNIYDKALCTFKLCREYVGAATSHNLNLYTKEDLKPLLRFIELDKRTIKELTKNLPPAKSKRIESYSFI